MKTFTASRLTSGNRLFPARIVLDDMGVTLREPSLFSGKETAIPFTRIASVNIDIPFVGWSTIHIQTTGEGMITVHGFLKAEVQEMKRLVLEGIERRG